MNIFKLVIPESFEMRLIANEILELKMVVDNIFFKSIPGYE